MLEMRRMDRLQKATSRKLISSLTNAWELRQLGPLQLPTVGEGRDMSVVKRLISKQWSDCRRIERGEVDGCRNFETEETVKLKDAGKYFMHLDFCGQ